MEFIKEEQYLNIIRTYLEIGSVKETAERLNTYPIKVRRVLITEGLWSSRTSEAIGDLWKRGMSVPEIARELCLSEKNIQSYLPYTRGQYGGENRSDTAIRSDIYRERMRMAASSQPVKKSRTKNSLQREGEKPMENKEKKLNDVICLHLELADSEAEGTDDPIVKYGKVKKSISRDVLVPGDMTLHALHYMIQKLFGWQNSHLHSFSLPEEAFEKLTEDRFDKYAKLCGVYFRFPTGDFEDLYWDDDYEEGRSFSTWLRSKYTGPYIYEGAEEDYLSNQYEAKRVCEYFGDKNGENLSLQQITEKIDLGGNPNCLLEQLRLREVVKTDTPGATPIAQELVYKYDFGDEWEVRITASDLAYTEEEKDFVCSNYRPCCICKDGLGVFDDAGGMWGYRDFLAEIHEGSEEEQEELREWARYLGWTGRNVSPKNML